MKNSEFFIEKVQEGSKIRNEIDTVHHKKMGKLALLFQYVFGFSAPTFKFLKDMVYYTGGWPSENTPARLEVLIKHVSTAVHFLTFAGRTEALNKYCSQYGITINVNENIKETEDETFANLQRFTKLLAKLYPGKSFTSKKDVLNFLLDEGADLQGIICELADEIKISKADSVTDKCKINKKHYVQAVNIDAISEKAKTKQTQKEKTKEKIRKRLIDLQDNAQQMIDVAEVLTEKK